MNSKQIKNVAQLIVNIVRNAVQNHTVIEVTDESDRRMNICKSCVYFESSAKRCMECGCYMETKVKFVAAQCPIGKW